MGSASLSAAYRTPVHGRGGGRRRMTHRATSRGSPARACSAATPTGAGRSGSRSTSCSPTRSGRMPRALGTTFTVEIPTGSGRLLHPGRPGRRQHRGHGSSTCSGRAPTGGARATAPDRGTGPAVGRAPDVQRVLRRRHGRVSGASHQTGWTALVAHLLTTPGCPRTRGGRAGPERSGPEARRRPQVATARAPRRCGAPCVPRVEVFSTTWSARARSWGSWLAGEGRAEPPAGKCRCRAGRRAPGAGRRAASADGGPHRTT